MPRRRISVTTLSCASSTSAAAPVSFVFAEVVGAAVTARPRFSNRTMVR
jgi:hypothetical protein